MTNSAYDPKLDKINILYRDGSVKDIAEAADTLNISSLSKTVEKHSCVPSSLRHHLTMQGPIDQNLFSLSSASNSLEFSAAMIAQMLGGTVDGDSVVKVNDVARIEDGKPGALSFLANPKYEEFIYATKSSVVLVSSDFEAKQEVPATLIRVADPYSAFTALLEEYGKMMAGSLPSGHQRSGGD